MSKAKRSNQFMLTSDECELLLAFETGQTIEKTAIAVARDASGVSRQLAAIARKYPALEKRGGRWVLTQTGKRLNSYSRNSILLQRQLARTQSILRIGTNREFASRVIGPSFADLMRLFPNCQLMLLTFEYGTEEALLGGRVDVGFDCDRPTDPDIAYKMLVREPIVAVCSGEFRKRHEAQIRANRLYDTPHLLCERLHPDKILSEPENRLQISAMFNDISTARAACLAGAGWSLLPRYAVQSEIDSKKLHVISEKSMGESRYGVWWSRSGQVQHETIQKACDWLKVQTL